MTMTILTSALGDVREHFLWENLRPFQAPSGSLFGTNLIYIRWYRNELSGLNQAAVLLYQLSKMQVNHMNITSQKISRRYFGDELKNFNIILSNNKIDQTSE